MTDLAQWKAELRSNYKQLRAQQPALARDEKSELIRQDLTSFAAFRSAKHVYSYMAFPEEVQTELILLDLIAAGKQVYIPGPDHKTAPQEAIQRLEVVSGAFQATPQSALRAEQIDLFLVPGIVWDLVGYRIGFGRGYFDRLLAAARPDSLKVGLAFEFQVAPKIPREPWDIPVDALITEIGIRTDGGFLTL